MTSDFERLVQAYLEGTAKWDDVHGFAVEMEWRGCLEFPEKLREPLEELHMMFLSADERDDPQFRADNKDIIRLVNRLAELRAGTPEQS